MLDALVRRPGTKILALALAMAAASVAAGQGDEPAAKKESVQASAPGGAPASPVVGKEDPLPPKRNPEQTAVDDNWPTDDFGHPLRGCDVPWDLVPSK